MKQRKSSILTGGFKEAEESRAQNKSHPVKMNTDPPKVLQLRAPPFHQPSHKSMFIDTD